MDTWQRSSTLNAEQMTYIRLYLSMVRQALREECDLTTTQYRVLASLLDNASGMTKSAIARFLSISPAHVTSELKGLASLGLTNHAPAGQGMAPRQGRAALVITKLGVDKVLDADAVVRSVYERCHAPLSDELRTIVDSGYLITDLGSHKPARLKDERLFVAYEAIECCLEHESLITKHSKSQGLTAQEAHVLLGIADQGGQASPSAIADYLLMSRPTVTAALESLGRKGCLAISPDPLDRRGSIAMLTDTGWSKLRAFCQSFESQYRLLRPGTESERGMYDDALVLVVAIARKRRL